MIALFRIALRTVVAVTLVSCGGVQSEGNGNGGTGCGGTGGTGGTSSTGPSVSLEASRDPVPIEESAVLTWTVSNATECEADGDWFGIKLSAGATRRFGSIKTRPLS
jgi:hypothetical protein